MWNQEISDLIKPFNKSNVFKGVFSSNNLPLKQNFNLPAAFVVNLSPNYAPGSHWIGIFISSKKIDYYFDSYGNIPKNKNIEKWLKDTCHKLICNTTQIQHYNSKLCGQFLTIFILFHLFKKTMHDYILLFSKI